MAVTSKVFGQIADATSAQTLFTVGVGKQAQCSVIASCLSNIGDYITVAILKNGDSTTTNENYIAYQTPIDGNGIVQITGICLEESDVIKVFSTNGLTTFTATGLEVS